MTAIAPAGTSVPGSRPAPPDRSWSIESLWAADVPSSDAPIRGGTLPDDLRARFEARLEVPLRPDRPTIAANFVSTLDGIVALDRAGATGGREVSGESEPDRFLMGLLRAIADAVLVGAGTARASRNHAWTPGSAYPPAARGFEDWRHDLAWRRTGRRRLSSARRATSTRGSSASPTRVRRCSSSPLVAARAASST